MVPFGGPADWSRWLAPSQDAAPLLAEVRRGPFERIEAA